MEGNPHLVARRDDEAGGALQQTERLGRRIAGQPSARMPAHAVRGHRVSAAQVGPGLGHVTGRRRRIVDAGDPDRGRVQSRLLQGEARQGPADAQPRHQRDLHRDDRALALRMERRPLEAARRPRSLRRDLVPGRRRAALRERHLRRAGEGTPADVHHRRQRAAGRVHAARDAALRGVAAGASSSPRTTAAIVLASARTTDSVAASSAAAATPFHSADGWLCA